MNINVFENYIYELFGEERLSTVKDKGEFGFTIKGIEEITKIGYATNLTPETVEEAIKNKVDLILTHHDAWDFIYGMKEICLEKLKENNISHYYIHLPLDDAEFGNNVTLLEKLGAEVIDKFCIEEGFYCGRVGVLETELEFNELVDKIENILEEPVKSWKNNDRTIKKVGVLTGAGMSTNNIKEALELNCDVYITGEKILYTVQYAKLTGINLIVGSHTFTEIFGVERLANFMKKKYNEVEIVRLYEEHIEK